jgi:hypothetical protein
MAEAEEQTAIEKKPSTSGNSKKRKELSVPTAGYVCGLCGVAGHWIQQCPTEKQKHRRNNKKKKNNPQHEFTPGVDPSPEDEERAKEMQRIPPPNCYCLKPSRIKKVKKSSNPNSRAIGVYFFFCAEKQKEQPSCRFARPAEDELEFQKNGRSIILKKGTSKSSSKPAASASVSSSKPTTSRRVCTFFAKSGSCKKGDACTFSHVLATESSYKT